MTDLKASNGKKMCRPASRRRWGDEIKEAKETHTQQTAQAHLLLWNHMVLLKRRRMILQRPENAREAYNRAICAQMQIASQSSNDKVGLTLLLVSGNAVVCYIKKKEEK